jgi:hypothetical protein
MKKLTENQKRLLREFVNFTCEECHKKEKEVGKLEPHRVKQGGEYSLRNIKMCCSKCHEIFSSAQRIANGTQN